MAAPSSNDALSQALQHHQAGRLAEAQALYQQILAQQPNHVDALHMLGVLAGQVGRPDAAVELIRRALQVKPDNAEAYTNLGLALSALGRIDEATNAHSRASQLRPNEPIVAFHLAEALSRQSRYAEARVAYERTLKVNPKFVPALNGLGMALGELDRYDEALAALDRARALAPNDPLVHEAYGLVLQRRPQTLASAEQSFRKAVELAPNLATAWNGLGGVLRTIGRFDEAAQCFRRAMELRPDLAVFALNLTTTGRQAASAAEIDQLAKTLDRPGASVDDRITAGFGLGKLLDDAERFDEAFAHYAAANALVKQTRAAAGERFDADQFHHTVDQLIATFTPAFFEQHRGWGEASELPVFIVGMPRSGTTLVEQIAASHPAVIGAGELNDVDRISSALSRNAEAWTRDAIAHAAAAHLRRLQSLDPDGSKQRIADKMPGNVMELGLIATLFPTARVIICRRDARDNCLSCFFQHFSSGNIFAYDLVDCGRRSVEIDRLIKHWRSALPLRMLEVQYEEMVADLEGQSRRLIDFLGLPWDPACLAFHRTQRAVSTASSWQVRQPIYTQSVGRWRHYERHLRPLLDVLNQPNV